MPTSVFSRYNNAVNNINNPINLLNQIITSVSNLLTINKLPFISDELKNLYNVESNLIETLETSLIKIQSGSAVGFNKVIISSIVIKPERLLIEIDPDVKPLFSNLKNIFNIIFGDLIIFRDLKRMDNKFQIEDFFLFEIDEFSRYIINNPDVSILNTLSSSGNIIGRFLMKDIFKETLNQITFTNDFTIDIIDTRFSSYIDTNKSNIALNINNFLFDNILLLSKTSSTLKTKVQSVISNQLDALKLIFSNNISEIEVTFYGQIVLLNIISSLENYLVSISTDFIVIDDDDIKNKENEFYDNIRRTIQELKSGQLESLEKITYQFKNSPLFFVNSHLVLYNDFVNLILKDNDFLDNITLTSVPDINEWKRSLKIPNTLNFNFVTELDNSKSVEYNYMNHFIGVLSDFIDLKVFDTYLIDTLFVAIEAEVKKFEPNVKDKLFDNIDPFKQYFKMFFINEILNGTLWGEFKSEFRSKLASQSITQLTSLQINTVQENFHNQDPTNTIKPLLDNFILSSIFALVIDIILDGFRIVKKF